MDEFTKDFLDNNDDNIGCGEDIAVSVIVITYNHSQYIKQCLDSILMQKTGFRFEVLVGDDASSDGTQDILRDYAQRYPGIFQMILREENLGPTKNAYDLFQRARGRYLAHCEGDDYWTDENKLQLQYEVMESRPDLSACTHCVDWVNQWGSKIQATYNYYEENSIITLDMWDGIRSLGHINTCFQRNPFLEKLHDYTVFLSHDVIGDLCMELFALLSGDFLICPNNMAQYRRVISKSGDNAISHMYNDPNYSINLFNYWSRLEDYCAEEFHTTKKFSLAKKTYFILQIDRVLHYREKSDIEGLHYLFQQADNKLEYVGILVKHICKQLVPWLISLPKRCYKWMRRRLHNDILDELKILNQKVNQLDRKCNSAVSNTNLLRVFLLRQEQMMMDILTANGIELPEAMLEVLEIREREKEKADRIKLEKYTAIDQEHSSQLQETLEKHHLPPVPETGCMLAEEDRLAAKWRVYELLRC